MSRAVLVSIKPKWCELIARGKKTIEVRKTAPRLQTPFKCFIYETLDKKYENTGVYDPNAPLYKNFVNHPGKVIGEFVCDKVLDLYISCSDPSALVTHYEVPGTCMTDVEILDYLGNGKSGYGWHISDLVIYDKPKELGELRKPYECHRGNDREDCIGCWDCEIKRPPQSWYYVEEVTE